MGILKTIALVFILPCIIILGITYYDMKTESPEEIQVKNQVNKQNEELEAEVNKISDDDVSTILKDSGVTPVKTSITVFEDSDTFTAYSVKGFPINVNNSSYYYQDNESMKLYLTLNAANDTVTTEEGGVINNIYVINNELYTADYIKDNYAKYIINYDETLVNPEDIELINFMYALATLVILIFLLAYPFY